MNRLALFLLGAGWLAVASAATPLETQYAAVRAVGQMNGIALQCRYLDQVRRMKSAVVDHAPKERSFGLAFEESTNEAFLAFGRAGERCPGHAGFEAEVGVRIAAMAAAFAAE